MDTITNYFYTNFFSPTNTHHIQGKKMRNLFNRTILIGLAIFGQSAVQAHNSDGTVTSVFHFLTAPDHLGFMALLSVLLCAAVLRLKKAAVTDPIEK